MNAKQFLSQFKIVGLKIESVIVFLYLYLFYQILIQKKKNQKGKKNQIYIFLVVRSIKANFALKLNQ